MILRVISATSLALLLGACGASGSSFVAAPTSAALGRVVIYRNGVAYFERKAPVESGRITLTVPSDKVDDFLKSLTVADAKTHTPLPVSYPTVGATEGDEVAMTIQVNDPNVDEVLLTYITDAPAWKPSYRVTVEGQKDQKPSVNLQGWAIVDNTSGEDWERVRLGVGASSALSFRYDLRSVKSVYRETLESNDRFAVAPPTGGPVHGSGGAAQQAVLAELPTDFQLADRDEQAFIREVPQAQAPRTSASGSSHVARSGSSRMARTKTTADAAPRPAPPPAPVQELAAKIKRSPERVVIEAGGSNPAASAQNEARAQELRNALIAEGVAPAQIQVARKADATAGIRLVKDATASSDPTNTDDGAPVGESHFESPALLTVKRQSSAMVAVFDGPAQGDIVYLYDAESERGNKKFAFKSIRFVNPTENTLEPGPLTVYGEGRFIGEGLTEPVPPHATAVIPFALDRQVIVEENDRAEQDRIKRLTAIERGVLRTEVQHERTRTIAVTNLQTTEERVFIRHNLQAGWELTKSPKLVERMGESHLFEITVPAGETVSVAIVEATPLVKMLDLRTPSAIDLVAVYLQSSERDPKLSSALDKLIALHRGIANTQQTMELEQTKRNAFRTRSSELEEQLLTLKNIPNSGTLRTQLQTRLRDAAAQVDKATLALVDLEQNILFARIRFQDAVAELTLSDAGAPKTAEH